MSAAAGRGARPRLLVIAGPTASGKTAVAAGLARLVSGEVVSADSMQVYRGMDIGTAKPTDEEKQGVPHHLLDVAWPDEPFSARRYSELAGAAISDIISRGKTPILAGGTGFYINAVLRGADFGGGGEQSGLRERLASRGARAVRDELMAVDPASAEAIHENNVRRAAAALAHFLATGERMSERNRMQKARPLKWETALFVLETPRALLYARIDERAEKMVEAGLVGEAEALVRRGFGGARAMQAIGYREALMHLRGELGLREMTARLQQATRNYAKRQLTWFRNQNPDARRLSMEGMDAAAAAAAVAGLL